MNVYLDFDGNCREAFEFYRSIFGGEFAALQTYADGPEDMAASAQADRIMHVSLPLGDAMLMGSDTWVEADSPPLVVGTNFSIALPVTGRAQADAWFAGLAAQGQVMMPLQETFWGAYFGRLRDRYGITWMFNYDLSLERE